MLILASASQARHRLLEQAGIGHEVIISGIDESGIEDPDPRNLVLKLALAKAQAVADQLFCQRRGVLNVEKSAILACDSVFEFQGEVFGKPKDNKEAFKRWQRMSSNSGALLTGHVLIFGANLGSQEIRHEYDCIIKEVVATGVNFSDLSDKEIGEYVATGEPLECAGGFALEGRAAKFISGLDGCYSNVIGLSLPWLRIALKEAGLRD